MEQVRQPLVQAAEHLLAIAAREVRSAAAVQEEGVTRDQSILYQEALASRSVPGMWMHWIGIWPTWGGDWRTEE